MTAHNSNPDFFIRAQDHLVSNKTFELHWNSQKDMLVTHPVPDFVEMGQYYKSDAYISHTDAKKTLTDKLYQIVKRRSLKQKLRLVGKHLKGEKSLLDIGAGTGDFLQLARTEGWKIDGVEPNPDAVLKAGEKQIELKANTAIIEGTFSVITLWHVLEHLHNPKERLDEYHKLLNNDGVLIIAVPNFNSWDANHYKEFWAAYDVPRHLFHFSKQSISRLAGDAFKIEAIKPMLFDSFYVSLLSERYKNSKGVLFKGFINGLRSNLSGLSTKEYSSQIYVLRKRNN